MTPAELKHTLVSQIESVVEHLLPSGDRTGQEWCVGSIGGEPGKSLKVRLRGPKAGLYQDFANPEHKGDLLDLWQAVRGLSFVDTLREAKDFAGVVETSPGFWPKKQFKKPEKPKCSSPKKSLMAWAEKRKIQPETLKAFKIAQSDGAMVTPFISPEGNLELVKYRGIETKKIWSNKDPIPCLFGWQTVKDNDRDIVICEGEFDAMAWYQSGYPALSIPFGGGDGKKQDWIDYEFHRLERFEYICLSMDMDAAGSKAISAIVDRLGRHRCKVVTLPFKDANDCILQPKGAQLLTAAIQAAKTIDPEELKTLAEFHDEIVDELYPTNGVMPGMKLPWEKTHDGILLRPAEISLWAGINGHGKSVMVENVAVDGMSQGEKFCIASMEMKPRKIGKQIYRQLSGKAFPTKKELGILRDSIDGSMWIFEAYGTTKAKRVLEVFEYARKRYGVTQFIVDSLAKCGFAEDDYTRQKDFVDRLMEFSRAYDVHVHLVVHIRKGGDEKKIPGKMDIKGTGALTDMVDNVLIVWRNKPKEEDLRSGDKSRIAKSNGKPDTVLCCVKQRETGLEPSYGLWFDPVSCRFRGRQNEPPKECLYLK
jgi:twinkle protein